MDYWTIGNKASLLAYIIAVSYSQTQATNSWYTLAYLLYLCLNILIPIFKRNNPKMLLVVLSAVFIFYCAYVLDPLFLLLLPVNLYEIVWLSTQRRQLALILMILTVPFIPASFLPLYILTSSLSFLLNASVSLYMDKMNRLEAEREKMREDVHRLTRSLNENNEYLRQSEYTIKLEERNRLSQQIHDDVGHSMAGALIQMEASKRLLSIDGDKASELLSNAISISKQGLEQIRLTLKDLKPKSEELGINRLRLFVDELTTTQTVSATLTHQGDLDIVTPIQWKIIQQNATESVTNSLKYGKATAIHIEVHVLNKFIKAVVTDNGIGAGKVVKGLGIVGMEERAASAGGTVIVDGTKGFSVTTLLPYSSK
ncbi:sensor histidine kinase [Cohnella silvisoli]|uniref:histidine kinase n=1 Tax=Cohnella silvisoli TaxID=2873699 RepID=A0ABV1KSF2_9BACL|nr:histidine kinase [Cohnella silvisoli]MCD9022412.1 sensor histidine kinase [Cohnella silvisoli]